MAVDIPVRERTIDEYGSLFQQAGFELVGATEMSNGHSLIEAAPARG